MVISILSRPPSAAAPRPTRGGSSSPEPLPTPEPLAQQPEAPAHRCPHPPAAALTRGHRHPTAAPAHSRRPGCGEGGGSVAVAVGGCRDRIFSNFTLPPYHPPGWPSNCVRWIHPLCRVRWSRCRRYRARPARPLNCSRRRCACPVWARFSQIVSFGQSRGRRTTSLKDTSTHGHPPSKTQGLWDTHPSRTQGLRDTPPSGTHCVSSSCQLHFQYIDYSRSIPT